MKIEAVGWLTVDFGSTLYSVSVPYGKTVRLMSVPPWLQPRDAASSKCMARCTGCPSATSLSADDVVAAVLGLTAGPNYKSVSKFQLSLVPAKLSLVLRKAKAAMKAQFGSLWQPVGVFKTPTFAKSLPTAFLRASSRRGGLAGRGPVNSGTMLRRVTREEEEERVEQSGDEEEEGSDTSVASNVGSLLGCLEIE